MINRSEMDVWGLKFIGSILIGWGVLCLLLGIIPDQWGGTIDRDRFPYVFWFIVITFLGAGIFFWAKALL